MACACVHAAGRAKRTSPSRKATQVRAAVYTKDEDLPAPTRSLKSQQSSHHRLHVSAHGSLEGTAPCLHDVRSVARAVNKRNGRFGMTIRALNDGREMLDTGQITALLGKLNCTFAGLDKKFCP